MEPSFMKEYIKEKAVDKKALEKYFKIIEYFENNGVRDNYYSFHHIYPSFLYKQELGAKNRSYTIDKLDEDYPPEDNVIKIDNQYHVLAHYYLGKALLTKDAKNSFRIFDDWTREFEEYSEKDAIELGLNVKETSQPNNFDKYLTNKEKREFYKNKV